MNHGHVLLTVTAIYDPAFYYTPEKRGGRNVQDLMEKPRIYPLARCRDTLRISCCTEDIQQVTTKIDSSHNVPITCICLLFRGDHPAQEVESGEQIGGNVSSCGCTTSSTQYPDHIAPQRDSGRTMEKSLQVQLDKKREMEAHMSKDELIRE